MSKKLSMEIGKGTNGWILTPKEGDFELLDEIYGIKYFEVEEEKKYFHPEMNEIQLRELLVDIAKGNKMEWEFVGECGFSVEKKSKPHRFTVDLKWSLWYTDLDSWNDVRDEDQDEDEELSVISAAKLAFEGSGTEVVIRTAPKKEIRYGLVHISKGKANVSFYAVWDSPFDLVPASCPQKWRKKVKKEIEMFFSEGDGFYDAGENPIGASVELTVGSATFEELMEKIDQCEADLLEKEKENSKKFHEYIDAYISSLK